MPIKRGMEEGEEGEGGRDWAGRGGGGGGRERSRSLLGFFTQKKPTGEQSDRVLLLCISINVKFTV